MKLIIKGDGSVSRPFDKGYRNHLWQMRCGILWAAFMRPCPACAALFSSRTRRLHTDRGNVFSGGNLLRRFHGCKSYRRYAPLHHGLWRYDTRCSSYRHDGPSVRECYSRRRTILHRRTGISKYRQWCCPIFDSLVSGRSIIPSCRTRQ